MATDTEKSAADAADDDSATAVVNQTPEELRAELAAIRKEKDDTAKALKKANEEAKSRRLRLEELEKVEEERAQSRLSDEEKQRRAADERDRKAKESEERAIRAEAALVAAKIDHAVERAAHDAGFLYPADVPRLVDRDRIAADDDGKITGVKEAVDRLAKDRPAMIAAPRGGGSPQSIRHRQGGGGGGETRRAARQVDADEQELIELGHGGGRM